MSSESSFEELISSELTQWQQLLRQLQQTHLILDHDFHESIKRLALASRYALTQLNHHPQWIENLHSLHSDPRAFSLTAISLPTAVSATPISNYLAEVQHQLRCTRHRNLVEIIFRDVCMNQPISQTLQQLTLLAEQLIQAAVTVAEQQLSARHGIPLDREGRPVHLNVIAMGKLGGGELNFSSDIDLICCYRCEGDLTGYAKLSHGEFFVKVVKQLTQLLADTTEDGFVYRVDLRLRPWGSAGPIALSYDAWEAYLLTHAREWEQYAMVKARLIVADPLDAQHFNNLVKPFVYRRYQDYRVFDGLFQLKQRIDHQTKSQQTNDLKTGKGGIREIEFLVQAFQLLKGGRQPALQTTSIYQALQALAQYKLVNPDEITALRQAYDFLRLLENRLQMLDDQQVHSLPQKETDRQRIALLCGFDSTEALATYLHPLQQRVHAYFSSLALSDPAAASDNKQLHLHAPVSELAFHFERFPDKTAQQMIGCLSRFQQNPAISFLSQTAQKRLQVILPLIIEHLSDYQQPVELFTALLGLLSTISGRSAYLELLCRNPALLKRLIDLFSRSSWLAHQISSHPLMIESLLTAADCSAFNTQQLQQELIQVMQHAGDEELRLDLLRQFKLEKYIAIASAEIAQQLDPLQASEKLSAVVECLLQYLLDWCHTELKNQYGAPGFKLNGQNCRAEMAMIAYGKLGSRELHYESDVDIIFLHNSQAEQQQTDGQNPLQNSIYFARLAQKIITRATALTAAGKLFDIDTRLRPDGSAGMLVSSMVSYQQYLQEKAWTFEIQALIRARFIAGDATLADQFRKIRRMTLCRPRKRQQLLKDIREMREKIHHTKLKTAADQLHIKHGKRGLVDIEFITQYLVLAYANKFASLSETTDNKGLLLLLQQLQLLPKHCDQLLNHFIQLHHWLHQRVLHMQPAMMDEIESQPLSTALDNCWQAIFETTGGDTQMRGE